MNEFVTYAVESSVATITINRPEKRNALSYEMYNAIRDYTLAADADPDVRALVLTGAPGVFCAGTDLSELQDVEPGTTSQDRQDQTSGEHWFLYECSKPTIAAIDGPTAGLGVELATQCDFRIATPRARFSWIFVQRGLIPDTGAGTWLLPQVVGIQEAKRLVYSGRFLDADEARRIGFLLEVVDPEALPEAAASLAQEVSTGSPLAIGQAKALLNAASSASLVQHLPRHAEALTTCQLSEDHREGVSAFLEKRPAVFTGR